MNLENKKHFKKLPIYLLIIYSLVSIPITIYLTQKTTHSNQYAQTNTTPTPKLQEVTPNYYCFGSCPRSSPGNPTTKVAITYADPKSQTSPNPKTDPCDLSNASVQNYSAQKHHNRHTHHKRHSHSMLDFIIDFINLILKMLGFPTIEKKDLPNPGYTNPAPNSKQCPTKTPAAPTTSLKTTLAPSISSGANNQKNANVEITFYGSYDNDPKGSLDIAYPVKHQQAGGTGTYQDPLTFASPAGTGAYAWGTIIYVPLVQKYFIREDECAVSWTAPNGCGAVTHVDLYVGNPSSSQSVVNCENSLTPSGNSPIIIDPPANLPYDSTPIWDQASGKCMTPHN